MLYKSFLIILYLLENKINTIIFVNISTTRFGFIDKKFYEDYL